MSRGSLNPKIRFLAQKLWSVARVQRHTHTQTDRHESEYWGHPFRVSGFFPSTYHQGSAQKSFFLMSQGSLNQKCASHVKRCALYDTTHTKVKTEDTLSGFQEFFRPILPQYTLKHLFLLSDTSMKCQVELPYYSKFLLIAAYLASYNPMKYDRRFFAKVCILLIIIFLLESDRVVYTVVVQRFKKSIIGRRQCINTMIW